MRLSLIAIFLLACVTTPVEAQLYKWVDKDGNVTYTDLPPPKDVKDARKKDYGDNVTPSDDLPYSVRDAVRRNPVTLYANACGDPCDKARALLGARGIPFTDRNPETDQSATDALKEAAGGLSVPTLIIGARVLKGFADSEWQDALTSSGYPRTNPGIRAALPAPKPAVTPATAPAAAPAAPAPLQ
jgi:glutaredoxin